MNGYSEQSQRLARELAEKAARNLRRAGRTVTVNPGTGEYVVSPKPGGYLEKYLNQEKQQENSSSDDQSLTLARKVAEKAIRNLRRVGRSVTVDSQTGEYVVAPKPGGLLEMYLQQQKRQDEESDKA